MSLDPSLFASVPYGSLTALRDFAGTLFLYHHALVEHIFRTFGFQVPLFPIGEPGGSSWLQAIQKQYQAESVALGLGSAPDLSSFDLEEEEDHASFFFLLSTVTRTIRSAAAFT